MCVVVWMHTLYFELRVVVLVAAQTHTVYLTLCTARDHVGGGVGPYFILCTARDHVGDSAGPYGLYVMQKQRVDREREFVGG